MEKSPEAFRTIREVADAMALPQHVLRFWETRFPQIRPVKRAGGRRYYRPEDIERLRLIKRLLYEEGYAIKGVQKLFKEQGAQALTGGAVEARPPADAVEAGDAPALRAGPRDSPLDGAPASTNAARPVGIQPKVTLCASVSPRSRPPPCARSSPTSGTPRRS